MKNFLTILVFTLILSACSVPKPPKDLTPDSEATNVGNSTKTPNYNFTDGFIYHEWKGESPNIIYIPLETATVDPAINNYHIGHNVNSKHPIKKLVSSKFFDIYVDITEDGNDFRKATNMTDVAYDKLVRELEKYRSKIINVYGEPSNVDGNGKIEIVFHSKYAFERSASTSGYFQSANINKAYRYTAERDVLYINSKYMNGNRQFSERCLETIYHEFQHDVFAYRNGDADYSLKWINEALSESTYIVMYDGERGGGSGRNKTNAISGKLEADFSTDAIRNGQYFFDWQSGYIGSDNYTTASHFMYWLYIHGGGEQIIRDIASPPYKVPDLKSIGDAARKHIPALRGMSEADIVKAWHIANFLNNPSGIYGYKNKVNILTAKANKSDGKVLLYQNCAVYTTLNMFSANSSKSGLNLIQLKKGSDDLLIFNAYAIIKEYFPNPILGWLVKINPHVPRMMLAQPQQEEPMWVDYAFMPGEESITSADFITEEDMKREKIELIKELEKAENEETNSDDYEAELEIIE